MQLPHPSSARRLSAVRLFAVLLLLIFLVETAAMLFLHVVLPDDMPVWARSLLDASLLTAICVPFVWRFYLRPLEVSLEGEAGKAQAVMNTAADGIMVIDERGIVRCFNSAAEKLFGYTEAEMVGGTLNRLMPSPERERHDGYIARYLKTGEAHIVDTVRVVEGMRKDGTVFPMELAVSEVPLSNNRRLFTGIVRDVTERRRAEEALRQANEQLEAIFCNIPALVAYLDADFNFVRVNRTYAETDGRTPEFFVGKNHFALHPNAENEAIFRRVVDTGEPYVAYAKPFEYPDHPERGVTYWDWNLHAIKGEAGKVERLLLSLVNVTDRKRLQAMDALFPEINQQVLRGMKLPDLLDFICSGVARLFDLQFAWVGRKEPDGAVSIIAWAGEVPGYQQEIARIGVRWDDTPQGKGPTGAAIRTRQIRVAKVGDSNLQPWEEAARRFSLSASISIPLVIHDEVYGAFALYSRYPAIFDDPNMVRRLMAVSGRISMAVEAAMDQQRLLLLSSALSAAGNAVFITDRQGRIQWINDAFTRLSGYTAEEAIGDNPRILKSGLQDPSYYQALWQTILAGQVWSRETTERRKDGSFYTVQQTITPIPDAAGEITHFISIHEDITAQKLTEARIQYMASYDALTDLPNRTLFYDRLRLAIASAKRSGSSLALLFLDLDRFKEVNDTLGHHVGDLLLQSVAQRLKGCMRESDTVARLGGDEFMVILPEVSEARHAGLVAEKIIAALVALFSLEGHDVHIGTSIGIAFYPRDADSEDSLVRLADAAMYAAKVAGRNTFHIHGAVELQASA